MRTPVGVLMAALMGLAAAYAFSPRATPPLAATRLATQKLHVNTLARSRAALLAGGELGNLLYSTNEGRDWQSARVSKPRQALINQITMTADGLTGIAVGHEGWILRTTDGGLSWQEVAFSEPNGDPLMSVAQLPSGQWLAVGAFGRALRSEDGGKTWAAQTWPELGSEDRHLNRIVGSADGRRWLIVGERGLVLRSDDGGLRWSLVPAFYTGSFYNAVALGQDGWLVYGMRGNAYVQHGQGAWTRAKVPAPASFFGHAALPDGRLVLVGQGGLLATSQDGGESFQISRAHGRATLIDVLPRRDGSLLIASDAGLQDFRAAAPAATSLSAGAAR